jgi:phenylacetate-CoA ligase
MHNAWRHMGLEAKAQPFSRGKLPISHFGLDWPSFFAKYPLPDVFAETVFLWERARIEDLQNARFKEVVEIGWANTYYSKLWQNAGLGPEDIRSIVDVARLPTFNTDDLKQNQDEFPPFGSITGVGPTDFGSQPMKVQTSGGTTGKPRPTLFGHAEWELNGLSTARGLYIQGARPGDVLQVPATCALANLGWGVYKACHDYLGVMPLTTGSGLVTPTRRQLEMAFDYGTNIWMSFPEYFSHLAKVCREELNRDFSDMNCKFISTFLGPDTEGTLRRHLEEILGAKVYDNYGINEVALGSFECPHQNGLHIMEDLFLFEIVHTETGELLPDGETGNIVVTSLCRTIPPIIRMNTRDLGRIISSEKCECGSRFRRMDHFLGRSDDMVRMKGVNIYPMACLSAVRSDDRTTGEWLCVAAKTESNGVVGERLTVRVEVRKDVGSREGMVERLEKRLKEDLGVRVAVELVEEGELAPHTNFGREGKVRRLLDLR